MTTQNTGNWPDPERPNVPLFPDRDGRHVINIDPEGIGSELVYYWKTVHQVWVEYEHESADSALDEYDLMGWAYVGPCLTPEQIEALKDEDSRKDKHIADLELELSGFRAGLSELVAKEVAELKGGAA